MIIEIQIPTYSIKEIDIEFPYYYKQDLLLDFTDSIIYGKIEENKHTAIQETIAFNKQSKEYGIAVTLESYKHHSDYFKEKYKSDEKTFMAIKNKVSSFLENI